MNEEIRKNEIAEEEMEQVSGGYYGDEYAPNCEKCGTKMYFIVEGIYYYYKCPDCNHKIPVPF